jgi:hypothetical protein
LTECLGGHNKIFGKNASQQEKCDEQKVEDRQIGGLFYCRKYYDIS